MIRAFASAVLSLLPWCALAQAPGVTPKSILLGQSAAFSGPAAQLGIQMNIGTKAYALKDEGHGVAISQVVPFPWSPSVPVVKEYQTIMTKAGNTDFNFSSLEGFIVAKAMVEGLKRAGKDLTREKLLAALESMSNVDLGEFVISFSPSNHSG